DGVLEAVDAPAVTQDAAGLLVEAVDGQAADADAVGGDAPDDGTLGAAQGNAPPLAEFAEQRLGKSLARRGATGHHGGPLSWGAGLQGGESGAAAAPAWPGGQKRGGVGRGRGAVGGPPACRHFLAGALALGRLPGLVR